MKESINYYYNLSIKEVENYQDIYVFKLASNTYYFAPLKRINNELEEIISVSRELKQRGYPVHDIVVNRFGKVVTNVFNQNYILLRILVDETLEYDLKDIMKMADSLTLNVNKSKLYRNSWAELWSAKIDYFEYQIREIGKEKRLVLDSFSYYVGLGENAISYVNATTTNYQPSNLDKVTLSHRRVGFPNYVLNYFNPLSFIFDLEVRDIAEYIKSSFFAGENALNYLKTALKFHRFSLYSLQLLYARLLYPSYYFDIYEAIMNDKAEEEKLITVLEKSEEYEIFLKEAYEEICKYGYILRVEWILNKKGATN